MAAKRPARRQPPPPAPSDLLYGLEKSIPPDLPAPAVLYSLYPTSIPDPSRPPFKSRLNKPLPVEPDSPIRTCRSSSIYSGDSGYTKIVSSYADQDADEIWPVPVVLQPNAYRETVACLHLKRFSDALSPESVLTIQQDHDSSFPLFQLEYKPTTSPLDINCSHSPKFTELSQQINERRHDIVSPLSCKSQQLLYDQQVEVGFPQPSPGFPPESSRRTRQCLLDSRVSTMTETDLMPPPLNLARSSKTSIIPDSKGAIRCHQEAELNALVGSQSRYMQAPSPCSSLLNTETVNRVLECRLSEDSYSDKSFTIYDGIREAVRAVVKEKMRRKKEAKLASTQEKETMKTFEIADSTYPSIGSSKSYSSKAHAGSSSPAQRKFSWMSSRRSSVQQGFEKMMRGLSLRDCIDVRDDDERGRTRERGHSQRKIKHRAIPLTPYQKYGPDIWLSTNKRKREKVRQARYVAEAAAAEREGKDEQVGRTSHIGEHRHSATWKGKGRELVTALHNGRSQLLHVIEGMKGRSASEERRERIKDSITLVGPTDIGAQNAQNGWI